MAARRRARAAAAAAGRARLEDGLSERLLGASRELADLLGGYDGGWAFWTASLSALELAIARSRQGDGRFSHHPRGEFERLLRDVDDALGLAILAVAAQDMLNGEPDAGRLERHRADLAATLLERARQARDLRVFGPAGRPV